MESALAIWLGGLNRTDGAEIGIKSDGLGSDPIIMTRTIARPRKTESG